MFLRSILIKLPRVTQHSVVRTCTTTQQIISKQTEPAESESWQTIYKLHQINYIAKLSKLKVIQAALTLVGSPVIIGLESFQLVPEHTTELYAVLGITGTISLSLYSLCVTNVIGFVYLNPVLRKIRFGYVDFWGRRHNLDMTLKEMVSTQRKFNVYSVVKTTTAAGSLKLLKYGDVLDSDIFYRLFGDV